MAKQKSSSQVFEEVKQMTDDEMAKKILGNFHIYQNKDVIPEEVEGEETKTPQKVKEPTKDFSIY